MTSIELIAPAKVNLFLKVLNRRRDSYHNILTIFERISISDRVKITRSARGIEIFSDRFITRDKKANLAYKAARLLMDAKGIKGGVRISIRKRIPIGAGMGGGSSDGAAVLKGMNSLFSLGIGRKALMRLGRRLGADIPFFLMDKPFALGRGRGDRLLDARMKRELWHLVVYPGFSMSTRKSYCAFSRRPGRAATCLTRKGGDAKINPLLRNLKSFDAVESMLYNDLGDIAISQNRVIGGIIERLASSLGKKAIVSGSGPSVFCLYRARKEAERARRKLLDSVPSAKRKGWQVFVAGTLF